MAEHADTAVGELNDAITDTTGLDADAGDLDDSVAEEESGAGSLAGTVADSDDSGGETSDADSEAAVTPRDSGTRAALVFGLVALLAVVGLVGWQAVRAYQSHQAQQQRQLFLQVGRQAALNLTTINYTDAEADVQRILDAATGAFHDDFQQRSPAFIAVVKQARSKSEGTVTEAGLESNDANAGQVLVAVTVKTTNAGTAEPQPRAWRMRISVQKFGEDAKVSNVEFVP
jgi:Mce-associated membrane protein